MKTKKSQPMAKTKMTLPFFLDVYLHDYHVGVLSRDIYENHMFSFSDSYVEDLKRPTLSLGYKAAIGGLLPQKKPIRVKLPPFFSNLLPEGHLRRYIAQKAGIKAEREFPLLWLLGQDLPGAVAVKAQESFFHSSERVTKEDALLLEKKDTLLFSLAGIQLKFSALMAAHGGLTIPAHGIGGSWIVKLPSFSFPHIPENEYAMLTLAKLVGIEVPEFRLVPLSDIEGLPDDLPQTLGNALAVKRFDRADAGNRIHIEDFAQVYRLFPDDKYEKVSYTNIAHMLWIETGEEGLLDFICRLVFNIIIGNGDMHLKNWSLIYPDTVTPRLAPAYDFVSTVPYIPSKDMALSLAGVKNMETVTLELFSKLAHKAQLPERLVIERVKDTCTRVEALWSEHRLHFSIPSSLRLIIEKHMQSLPLLRHS